MIPVILAGVSLLSSASAQNSANGAMVDNANTNAQIAEQARNINSAIGKDTAARNDPYYKAGIAQLPSVIGMSSDPDFSVTGRAPATATGPGAEYGDKYSKGAAQMVLGGPRNNLISLSELNSNFNRSEQPRLLNRRMDLLRVGYGNTGAAGNSLMQTGSTLADISSNLGETQANSIMQQSAGRQNLVNDTLNSASYAPLYMYNRKMNEGA